MKQKTLLFFSCEPGGAEVLIPVIKLVRKETRHKVVVCSYGLGAERFAGKGVEYNEIGRLEKNDTAILEAYHPDLIITSATSLPDRDMSEKYIWHNARCSDIPTLAFLDQWQNYVVRFSGPMPHERLFYLPDYINCINDIGEAEMVAEGFDVNTLVKFGHPYLSSLKDYAASVDAQEIRRRLNVGSSEHIVLFVSEAIREHYGRSRGYDQFDALTLFLELMSHSTRKVRPIIKLHPKDTAHEYGRMLDKYKNLHSLLITNNLSPVECINVAEEVYGMTSIMLIEAFVLGKNVVSLQPGLQGEDAMILSRLGLIQKLTKPNVNGADSISFTDAHSDIKFEFVFKSREFLDFVERILKAAWAHS
jgi:hypothetical protein